MLYEAVPFHAYLDIANELNGLAQYWNAAVLDSSASKMVCGQVWLDNYVDPPSEKEKFNIQFLLQFWRWQISYCDQTPPSPQIPANMGGHQVMIEADVIASDI